MDFSIITSPIRTFQSMVQCAANTAESIPKEDMLMAFRTSVNLLERIGELMSFTNSSTKSSPNSYLKNGMSISQNSFLNSFHNNNNNNVDFSVQSPNNFRNQQDSILFSNRMTFSNPDSISAPCILPISSSPSFAALNDLMKNGNLSNTEVISSRCDSNIMTKSTSNEISRGNDFQFLLAKFLNNNNLFPPETSLVEDENSGRNSEDPPNMKMPYLTMVQPPVTENSYSVAESGIALWNNRPASPLNPSTLPKESTDLSDDVINSIQHRRLFSSFSSRPRPEHRKSLNSDELNRLLDSCEIRSGGLPGKKNYKCKFCGKMYDIKSSIRYHIRIIHLKMHLKTADMQCKLCGRVFTCATAANKHQLRCLKSGGSVEDLGGSHVPDLKKHHLAGSFDPASGVAVGQLSCTY